MIPQLLIFFLFTCEPSHDFVDETVPSLLCQDEPCCSESQNLWEIFPTEPENPVDQENEQVDDYDLNSAWRK